MKRIVIIPIITVFLMIIASCSNPLDKKYNESTLQTDFKEIVESKKADTTDMKYIAIYMVRAKILGEKLEGKTYKDILSSAKQIREDEEKQQAEEKALAAKVSKEEKEKREMFGKILTVALYDKGYEKADYEDYLTYGIAFKNKGLKDIRAIKGTLVITDLFDSEIKSLSIVMDDGIKANATFKNTYTTDYNQFTDEDTRLRSKNLKDIKVVWNPEKIIFSDGTTLD